MFKFDVKVDVHVHLPNSEVPPRWARELLTKMLGLESSMTKIEEKLNVYEQGLVRIGTAVDGIATDITGMAAEIVSLKEQIANGGLTPELEAKMDDFGTRLTAAAEKLEAVDALNPATPPANPGDAGNGEAGTNEGNG
jgi:hypothetical protein